MRQQETLRALKSLGIPEDHVTFLGYPNQYLNQMWSTEHWLPDNPVRSVRTDSTSSPYNNSLTPNAVFCGESMLGDVRKVLLRVKPDVVVTIHPNDIHIDHWPTGAVVRFTLMEFAHNARLYTYLIHRDLWPVPRSYRPRLALDHPQALEPPQTLKKHQAIAMYKTQGGNIDPLLRAFARRNDLFALVPVGVWPGRISLGQSLIIRDSVADRIANREHPYADIQLVHVRLVGGRLAFQVTLRDSTKPGVTYHLSLHSGGVGSQDRTIAYYHWSGPDAFGSAIRSGRLEDIDNSTLAGAVTANVASIELPSPLEDGTRFIMVKSWTTMASKVIDETAETAFAVTP